MYRFLAILTITVFVFSMLQPSFAEEFSAQAKADASAAFSS